MNRTERDQQMRDLFFCGAALAALELTAAWLFLGGRWAWDWTVRTSAAGLVLLAAGALLLWMGNRLLWKLESLTADRDLRTYWSYCAGLMVLCILWWDLDTSFHLVLILTALVSTPLGLVGAALGAFPDGAQYSWCYWAMLALSAAEAGYHHWLLRRHSVLRAGYTGRKG